MGRDPFAASYPRPLRAYHMWAHGALAQLGERLVCNQEVAGSIPAGSMPLTMVRKLALLAVVPLALTACGTTEIDAGKTETFIKENVTGPAPRSVECPEGVEAEKGETFECKLTYEHGVTPAAVTVHIEDDDGRVRFGPGDFKVQP
jgi:Domain of unknown function (DUF4333)